MRAANNSPRNHFKIAGKKAPFRLFPVPVVENKKFFIECENRMQADLLAFLLLSRWLVVDLEQACDFWVEQPFHTDGRTRVFSPNWHALSLNYFPEREALPERIEQLEKVLSQAISTWVLTPTQNNRRLLLRRVKAQMECKSCQKLGVAQVKLEKLIPHIQEEAENQ